MGAELEKKQFYIVLSIISGGLLLSLYLHIFQFWSPLQLPENVWLDKLNLHLTYPPFAIRPINSAFLFIFNEYLNLPVRESFIVIQYVLYIITSIVLYRFFLLIFENCNQALIGLAIWVISFPVLCAHFEPLFTWNDFWLYLFILLTIFYLFKNNFISFSFFYFLSLLAHEQAIIFSPIFIISLLRFKKGWYRSLLLTGVPIFIFIVYRIIRWEDIDTSRWTLFFNNFSSYSTSLDSIVSFYLVYGAVWLFSVIGLVSISNHKSDEKNDFFRLSFYFVLPLNLIAVFFFAFARETRLFFITYIFIIPLAVIGIVTWYDYFLRSKSFKFKLLSYSIFILSVLSGIRFTQNLYLDYFYRANSEVRTLFLGMHLGISILVIFSIIFGLILKSSRSPKFKIAIASILSIMIVIVFYQSAWPVLKGPVESKNLISKKLNFNDDVSLLEVKSLKVKNRIIEIDFTLEIKDTIEDDYLVVWYLKQKNGEEVYSRKFTPDPQFSSLKPIDTVILKRFDEFPKGELQLVFDIYNEKGHLGWPVTTEIGLN